MEILNRHDVQGLNLYSYVMNNPVNYIDPSGLDAIWLTHTKGAARHGHAAIAFQDYKDDWWFMSFEGLNGVKNDAQVFLYQMTDITFNKDGTVKDANFLVPDGRGGFDTQTWYNKNAEGKDRTFSLYDHQVYIQGDFSDSLPVAQFYQRMGTDYNVLANNCAWVALNVLAESMMGRQCSYYIHEAMWRRVAFIGPEVKRTIRPNSIKNNIGNFFVNQDWIA
jgi:hypothetical protein